VNDNRKNQFWERLRKRLIKKYLLRRRERSKTADPAKNTPENNNQAPPDLDALWQDFVHRLNSLFQGKLPSKKKGLSGPPGHHHRSIRIAILCSLLIASWLGSGFYLLRENQASVVMQFGAYQYTATSSGMHWRWPWPLQSNERVDLARRYAVVVGANQPPAPAAETALPTAPQQEEGRNIPLTVAYRIHHARDFLLHTLGVPQSQSIVIQAGEVALQEMLAVPDAEDALYEDREKMMRLLQKKMQHLLDIDHSGLLITQVSTPDQPLPAPVQQAIDAAGKARAEGQRQKEEAVAEASRVLAEATQEAAQQMSAAESYKIRVIAQATGDMQRFRHLLVEYSKAPIITREHLYLETMEYIYANSTKIFVDSRAAHPSVYLKLDQLLPPPQQPSRKMMLPDANLAPPSDTPYPAPRPIATMSDNDQAHKNKPPLPTRREVLRNRAYHGRPD
jgi:modulator of FtsH protease HflK